MTDGHFGDPVPVSAAPKITRPFKNNAVSPDVFARLVQRRYLIAPRDFSPRLALRTIYTNYLLRSEDYTDGVWTKTNVTISGAARANPWDGNSTFTALYETSANAEHALQQAFTFTAAPHTVSGLVAAGLGRNYVRLQATDGTTTFKAFFDLSSGVVLGTPSNCTAAIRRYRTGEFRISITFTPAAAAGNVYLNISTNGSTVSYAGDTTKGIYAGGMQVERASSVGLYVYTAGASRNVTVPDVDGFINPTEPDPDDFAFLVDETDVEGDGTAPVPVVRTYARIPRRQVSFPGNEYITKPQFTAEVTNPFDPSGGVDSGSSVTFSPYATSGRAYLTAGTGIYTSSDGRFYTGLKSNGGAALAISYGYATGGTFTLTYKTSTTGALAYNASNATIEAALNALASVIADGIAFHAVSFLSTTPYGKISFSLTAGTTTSPVTLDATSLTVSTSKNPGTQVESNFQQSIWLPTHLTLTGHGYSAADALIVLWDGESYTYATGQWGVIDANTIWVPNRGNNTINAYYGATYASSTTPVPPDPSATYVAGIRFPPTKLIEDFYLPGFSYGIASPTDITVSAGLQNEEDFLNALLVPLTGFQDYRGEGPKPWDLAPMIYRAAVTQLLFDKLV